MVENKQVIVFVTAPRGKGKEIALKILNKKLAACINIASVESLYWWQGKIEEDQEDLLVIKTTDKRIEELVSYVKEIHPYTVPEIIYWTIEGGNKDYLEWVDQSTQSL